jgi:hypothetical protein
VVGGAKSSFTTAAGVQITGDVRGDTGSILYLVAGIHGKTRNLNILPAVFLSALEHGVTYFLRF